jgi:pimeloyl-ACP methyl ester carboxylesterase
VRLNQAGESSVSDGSAAARCAPGPLRPATPERGHRLGSPLGATGERLFDQDRHPLLVEFGRLFEAGDRGGLVRLGLATWAAAGDDVAARSQVTSAVSALLTDGALEEPLPPVYGRLGDVQAPTVMVRGDREYPMVADCFDLIAARIPGCRQIVIPGADHLLPLRVPGQLAQIITEQAG